MTRWIENCSMADIRLGHHYDAGSNSMLIQITDPGVAPPIPKRDFSLIHEFQFLDAEDEDGFPDELKFSTEQANQIAQLLLYAKDNHMNVVVHCHMGICRSGAVVEVAEIMGFTPTDRFRQPNLRVKSRLMTALGWGYENTTD